MVSSRSCASRYLAELNEEYNLSAGSCSVKESTRDDSMAMNRDLVMCGDRQFYFLKGLHTLSGTECQWVRKKPAKVEELYLCRVRVGERKKWKWEMCTYSFPSCWLLHLSILSPSPE